MRRDRPSRLGEIATAPLLSDREDDAVAEAVDGTNRPLRIRHGAARGNVEVSEVGHVEAEPRGQERGLFAKDVSPRLHGGEPLELAGQGLEELLGLLDAARSLSAEPADRALDCRDPRSRVLPCGGHAPLRDERLQGGQVLAGFPERRAHLPELLREFVRVLPGGERPTLLLPELRLPGGEVTPSLAKSLDPLLEVRDVLPRGRPSLVRPGWILRGRAHTRLSLRGGEVRVDRPERGGPLPADR